MREVKKLWGGEKHFVFNDKCTVKLLEVKPHQMLSLQYHRLRKEEWYFLTDGFAQVGMEKRKVKKGDLGFKTGRGFYQWTTEEIRKSRARLQEYLLKVSKD